MYTFECHKNNSDGFYFKIVLKIADRGFLYRPIAFYMIYYDNEIRQ